MKVVWTAPAEADLEEAAEYIARDNLTAAATMSRRIRAAVDGLSEHPRMGRAGRMASSRELVVSGTPYLVIYRLAETAVEILRVVHGAQRWPPE